MGWFGGGSDDGASSSSSGEKGFMDSAAPHGLDATSSMALGGAGASPSDLQQFGLAIQEQMVVQQAITELTDKAFAKCIGQCKDGQLSGKEVACIHAVTNKWLDANEYMVGRLARKQQQAMGQGGFS